jgi:phage regulator Rha-like protein
MPVKSINTFDDLSEALAECAIGTEMVKEIEEFISRQKMHLHFQNRRFATACRIIGESSVYELMDEDYE